MLLSRDYYDEKEHLLKLRGGGVGGIDSLVIYRKKKQNQNGQRCRNF